MSNALEKLREQEARLRERMKKVKHKIAVISGKGGVGKSIITVNLAMALAPRERSDGRKSCLDGFSAAERGVSRHLAGPA